MMNSPKQTTIIGAGQAGATCALKLRELGYTGAITLIGDERQPPYERPALSKGYLSGTIGLNDLVLLEPDAAKRQGIELFLGTPVREVDRRKKCLHADDRVIPYDTLVFATGGRARRLPAADILPAPSLTIRTSDDADRLRGYLGSISRAAVIGGGWLGLELAATCRQAGAQVDLFEAADRLCARVAPAWLSTQLTGLMEGLGVALHIGSPPGFSAGGILTADGQIVVPDLVLKAVGMHPNDGLAMEAGLDCADGILVDSTGHTADPSVFAIGDCARLGSQPGPRRESWQNANQSAEKVARAIIGLPQRAPEPDWFWSTIGTAKIQMIGVCSDEMQPVVETGSKPGSIACRYVKEERDAGCIAINYPKAIAQTRRNLT